MGSAEVFLYLLSRSLFINRGYRFGLTRIGCVMCPFSSKWSNAISALAFPDDVGRFLSMLRDYARQTGIPEQEIDSYLGAARGRPEQEDEHSRTAECEW